MVKSRPRKQARTNAGSWHDDEEDVDCGWAWAVLLSSFVVNTISLGTNFSFGVYYAEFFEYFGKGKTQTAFLISVACALVLVAGITSRNSNFCVLKF